MGCGATRPAAHPGRRRRRQRSHGPHGRRNQRRRRSSDVPAPPHHTLPQPAPPPSPATTCQWAPCRAAVMPTAASTKATPSTAPASCWKTRPRTGGECAASHEFVTKDRPGHLLTHGRPTKTPGKTYIGTLVVDDSETVAPTSPCGSSPPHPEEPPETIRPPSWPTPFTE